MNDISELGPQPDEINPYSNHYHSAFSYEYLKSWLEDVIDNRYK